ncbi:Retrovirus-related Pol polyprotein from transposon RE1 [Vitis vinifera]|uniref:Retrovirus-related Pol polyprotein from transposon RE1 n=2 Tax=Vitis TaxID=3603 RepID=A0A438HLD7_VITVI|nr:Retrovirus-related Pol polyprotein from transposon RE1 [Vitis vinifera]
MERGSDGRNRALEKNGSWEVMTLPRGKKPGFTQTYNIDYTKTFAPVAKLNTIRVLLSLATNLDWPLHQFDIKNAFLNGELEEEVFMTLPPGFCKEEEETRVCKLKKSLYGLKQSPRAWIDRFAKVIKNQGYQQGQSDHTMFFKQSNDGRMTILIVYVDDIILTGDNTREVERLKKVLATEFEVKDLGQMRYFLGMEVARLRKGISISQRKYVLDLLTETGMIGCKPSDTPIKARKRTESNGKPVDRERYQRLVGRLIYLSHTRPDIAFAGNLVTWRSKKQSVVAKSSAETNSEQLHKIGETFNSCALILLGVRSGPWQVMLKQADGSYACVAESATRFTLGETKEELLRVLGLQEEEGSSLEFLRRGYKSSTWWEEDVELESSSAWRS